MKEGLKNQYELLRSREYEDDIISIGKSTVAFREWIVVRRSKFGEGNEVQKFRTDKEAWQQFHGWCMAAEERESARWLD